MAAQNKTRSLLNAEQNRELVKFCVASARQAGGILLKHFGRISFEREKEAKDPVTNVDLEAQEFYVKKILAKFPGHGILGEESGSLGDAVRGREYTWIIDPLDGTVNYSAGIPLFCTSIAIARNGESLAGAVYYPILRELFYASKGGGAFLNGKRIRPVHRPLEESVVTISFSGRPEKNEFERELIQKLNPFVRSFRALGSTVYEVCHIACGQLAASIHTTTAAWDAAASCLIAEEAGCVATDFDNRHWNLENQNLVVSNNPKTHATIMKQFREIKNELKYWK